VKAGRVGFAGYAFMATSVVTGLGYGMVAMCNIY